MKELIKEFGKENIIIMVAIVAVVLLALVLIIVIEKINEKKTIKRELKNIEDSLNEKKGKELVNEIKRHEIKKQLQKDEVESYQRYKEEQRKKEEQRLKEEKLRREKIEQLKYEEEKPKPEIKEKKSNIEEEINLLEDTPKQEVYYTPIETSKEKAKEKLEEVTKRLIDEESNLIDHTHFEVEQEEKSIISYDELIKASHDIDEKNDRLLKDEDEAAITIEELYKKHQEEQTILDEINNINNKVKVNNPEFIDEPKKFKNSEVISPVFGIYSGKVKNSKDVLKEINKDVRPKDLEDEIQRTEDFLTELKKLKNKLD